MKIKSILLIFLLMISCSSIAGEEFSITMVNNSDYKLHFNNAKSDCVYHVMENFSSSYLNPKTTKKYKLEVSNKFFSKCAWQHGTYSFDVSIVTKINKHGKIEYIDKKILSVSGKSGAESSLCKIQADQDNLNEYHLASELGQPNYTITTAPLE